MGGTVKQCSACNGSGTNQYGGQCNTCNGSGSVPGFTR
jgi:hypothetical protein